MKKKPTTEEENYQQFPPERKDISTAKRITSIIHELGVPDGLVGHNYIRTAVYIAVQYKGPDYFKRYGFFGEILRNTAIIYKTDYNAIERGIRHAISVAWERGNPEAQQRLFGWTVSMDTCRPTCSEFIATVADVIRMEACYND